MTDTLNEELDAAKASVEYGQTVRALYRRRTERGDTAREADIRLALERLRSSMRPLRTRIGKFPYEAANQTTAARQHEILSASAALQSERRKLWKMLSR